MKMSDSKAFLKYLIAGLLAATLLAGVLSAQSAPLASGTFTLPFGAQWGALKLAPGTYSFSVNSGGNTYVIHVNQGLQAVGVVLTSSFSSKDAPTLQNASLLCVHNAATCSIGALKMPLVGVFYFNLPQSARTQLAQTPDMIDNVPVLFAKK